jgi:hypothetical protein
MLPSCGLWFPSNILLGILHKLFFAGWAAKVVCPSLITGTDVFSGIHSTDRAFFMRFHRHLLLRKIPYQHWKYSKERRIKRR